MTDHNEPFPYVALRFPIPVSRVVDLHGQPMDDTHDRAESFARTLAAIAALPDQCPWVFERLPGYEVVVNPATYHWACATHMIDYRSVMDLALERSPGLTVKMDRVDPVEAVYDERNALRRRVAELTEALCKRREVDAIRKLEIEELKAEIDRLKDAAIADRITSRCREEGV